MCKRFFHLPFPSSPLPSSFLFSASFFVLTSPLAPLPSLHPHLLPSSSLPHLFLSFHCLSPLSSISFLSLFMERSHYMASAGTGFVFLPSQLPDHTVLDTHSLASPAIMAGTHGRRGTVARGGRKLGCHRTSCSSLQASPCRRIVLFSPTGLALRRKWEQKSLLFCWSRHFTSHCLVVYDQPPLHQIGDVLVLG